MLALRRLAGALYGLVICIVLLVLIDNLHSTCSGLFYGYHFNTTANIMYFSIVDKLAIAAVLISLALFIFDAMPKLSTLILSMVV